MLSVALLLMVSFATPPLHAEPTEHDIAQGAPSTSAADAFGHLAKFADKLDWEAEYAQIGPMLERTWRDNGWTNESDQYALGLASEIAAIPPWHFMRRLDVLGERLADRYGLSPSQQTQLKAGVMSESATLLARHAGVIFGQANEAIRLKAAGKPFTPALVQRWMRESDPIVVEALKAGDRLVERFEPMMDAEHSGVFRRDRESYEKRVRYMETIMTKWKEGQWHPDDWNLQEDPMYARMIARMGRRPSGAASRGKGKRLPVIKCVAHDPTTWFAYVLECKKRFGFDVGQMTTAESIHTELVDRAKAYMEARTKALEAIPRSQRGSHESFASVRRLFAELQQRVEAVATTVQRTKK